MFSPDPNTALEVCRDHYTGLLREVEQARILRQTRLNRPSLYQQCLASLGEFLMLGGWWLKQHAGPAHIVSSEQTYILRQPRA